MNLTVGLSIAGAAVAILLLLCCRFSKQIKRCIQKRVLHSRTPAALERKETEPQSPDQKEGKSQSWKLGLKTLKEEMLRYQPKIKKKPAHPPIMVPSLKLNGILGKNTSSRDLCNEDAPASTERQVLNLQDDTRLETKEGNVSEGAIHKVGENMIGPHETHQDLSRVEDHSFHLGQPEIQIEYKKKPESSRDSRDEKHSP